MTKQVTHLDMNKLEIRQGVVQVLAGAPSTPTLGQFYFDSALLGLRAWDGTTFSNRATDSLLLGGQNLAYTLARANATGTQTAATISDLGTVVQGYTLNQFAVPTASLSLNNQKIINLADPTAPQDAATMGWVQVQVNNAAAGIDAKASVRFATTVNDTLSGVVARDGVTPVVGDRALVKNQTTASSNGVYIVGSGAWSRALDADTSVEITPGSFWYVEEGTVNGKTQWRLENTGTIVIGTTALAINQFGGAATSYTASNGILLTGNNFTAVAAPSGGLIVNASGISIDTAVVARKFAATIAGSVTATVTHNLGTQDVIVSVRDATTNEMVAADWTANGINTVTVTTVVGGAAAYRVVITG